VLLVHHTDAQREWAYDRDSHVGKLDKALDEAHAKGWAVRLEYDLRGPAASVTTPRASNAPC